jgi:hypothetical protein
MKVLLLCPSESPAVDLFSRHVPLSNVPLLGHSLLEYWLSHLASSGVEQVLVVAHDRPEQVQAVVGHGERWGLSAKVAVETRALTPAQAWLKYGAELDQTPAQGSVVTLDHFPGLAEKPVFASYAAWFEALQEWMPHALTPDRVGMREVQPGVWLGRRSQISASARLRPPCWVGAQVTIGRGAGIGPNVIVEDGACIEPGVEIVSSCVGPSTFVGRGAWLAESVAWGDDLVHWPSGAVTTLGAPFLVRALRRPRQAVRGGWLNRIAQACGRRKEGAEVAWKDVLLHREN